MATPPVHTCEPMMIWAFADAPAEYQKLAPDGGAWIALVPKACTNTPWPKSNTIDVHGGAARLVILAAT